MIAISADADGGFKLEGDKLIVTGCDDAKIEVVDMNGRTINVAKGTEMSVNNLPNGVYVATVATANGVSSIKFVKF